MTDTTIQSAQIPGYATGRWLLDAVHPAATFTVRHVHRPPRRQQGARPAPDGGRRDHRRRVTDADAHGPPGPSRRPGGTAGLVEVPSVTTAEIGANTGFGVRSSVAATTQASPAATDVWTTTTARPAAVASPRVPRGQSVRPVSPPRSRLGDATPGAAPFAPPRLSQ